MQKYLMTIALGPVQEFIAAARRTADLTAGSKLLVELARHLATHLVQHHHADLIFPASTKTGAPNKLLFTVSGTPHKIAADAKEQAHHYLREQWDECISQLSSEIQQSIDTELVNWQLKNFLEFYAAWVPLNGNYQSARRRLAQLLDRAQGVKASEVYRAAFNRWKEFAQQPPSGRARVHFTVKAEAPIAIGLGNASPLEVGIRLHHTYGMPLLPASALKGMCRRVAYLLHRETKLPKEAVDALFGYSDEKDAAAGAIVFYDAYYDPASADGSPFHRDVITVHHPKYYIGGEEAPTDFDDPTPVPFLVIKPGARFLCVLDAPHPDWANFAKEMLLWGLQNLGIGAKTNAGYGYLTLEEGAAATGTATAASTKSVPLQPEEDQWEKAHITYEPGPKILKARNLSTKERAETRGAQAQELLNSLPDPQRTQLLEKKPLIADVVVEQLGNQCTIKRILPPETG